MINNSAKQKIIVGLMVWVGMSFLMYFYVFKKFDLTNETKLSAIQNLKKEQFLLEAERDSFLKGKSDLEKIEKEKIKPTDFFSKDITLVNEIRRLEQIGAELNLDLALSGVSGTIKSARKAGTKSEIFQIPVSMNVKGTLQNAVSFLEYLENLEFLTIGNMVNFNSVESGIVSVSLNASFFVKK